MSGWEGMSRREFLRLGARTVAAFSGLGLVAACARNPVTGQSQFMLMSEQDEVQIDRQYAPRQHSNDYGPVRDKALNQYVDSVGQALARRSHRPEMPYSFEVLNATYVNAYAFPGGSIACTRGILVGLSNEAELAALLGHEAGHVNARHTAARMSQGTITQLLLGGAGAAVGGGALGQVVSGLGSLGASAMLASYSRDDERQADALGQEYMVRAGYNPWGEVQLMEFLVAQQKARPSALETLFATHPMSEERLNDARERAQTQYAAARDLPLLEARFMDNTAALRRQAGTIRALQDGEKYMGKKNYREAAAAFDAALAKTPDDYAGLLMMAKCQAAMERWSEAGRYAAAAKQAYPGEPQALYVEGYVALAAKRYDQAYDDFAAFDKALPGNLIMTFLRGYCREQQDRTGEAAALYRRYLEAGGQGKPAQYAYARLVQWGYIRR